MPSLHPLDPLTPDEINIRCARARNALSELGEKVAL